MYKFLHEIIFNFELIYHIVYGGHTESSLGSKFQGETDTERFPAKRDKDVRISTISLPQLGI